MQLVIDIDDKTYKAFMELISVNLGRSNYKGIIGKCLNAIKHGKVLPKGYGRLLVNGTPLPKGHGRIGDLDALERDMIGGIKAANFEKGYADYAHINNVDDCVDCVRYADTIIEADKGDGGNDG